MLPFLLPLIIARSRRTTSISKIITKAPVVKYRSAEEARAEIGKREHERIMAEVRRDDDKRVAFGLALLLSWIVLGIFAIHAGYAVTWDIRDADMTTSIRFDSFLAALPYSITSIVCMFSGWHFIKPTR